MKNKDFVVAALILIISSLPFNSNFSQIQPKAWYVYKNATGSNNGTSWTNAWTSPSSINWSNIGVGDTIYISGGTDSLVYTQSFSIGKSDVTITKGKTQGHNGRVILKAPTPAQGIGINVSSGNRSRVAITDLEFQDWNYCIYIRAAFDSFKVANCKGIRTRAAFLDTWGGDTLGTQRNFYFLNNYIETASESGVTSGEGQTDGISVYYVRNSFIIGNKFINKNSRALDNHNDFIQGEHNTNQYVFNNFFVHLSPNTSGQNGISGMDNGGGDYYVVNNVFVQGSYTNNSPIWMTDRLLSTGDLSHFGRRWSHFRILNNTFIVGHHRMIVVGYDSLGIIKNNIFYSTGTYEVNNTFGRPFFIQSDMGSGVYQAPVRGLDIKYNSFYAWYDTSTIKYLSPGSDGAAPPRHSSNGYYYPQNNYRPSFVNVPALNRPITYNVSSFPYSLDPQDYKLSSNSIREIGTALVLQESDFPTNNLAPSWFKAWEYIKKDFNGIERGSIWDRGAFQFSSAPPITDITPPEVLSATLLDSLTLSITFSEPLNQQSAININNYSIDNGINVISAQLNNNIVRLTTSLHSPGFYTVSVSNVTDLAGNIISPQHNSAEYGYNPDPLPQLLKFPPAGTQASSVPEPDHLPEKTFDGLGYNSGDPTSRWAGQYLPQWIGYDLGHTIMLSQTKIQFYNWQNGRIYNYTIQVSTDSINWTNVKTNIPSQLAEWSIETFYPVPARYVRIVVLSNNQNDWASLWETEFYGQLMVSNNDDQQSLPSEFSLEQNYPNPFNPATNIQFSVGISQKVTLKVFDVLGSEVATLVDEYKERGRYKVEFDASALPSGIYIYILQSDTYINTKKMVLLR